MKKLYENLNRQLDQPAKPHKLRPWHWLLLIVLIGGTVYVARTNDGSTTESDATPDYGYTYQRCEGMVFGTIYHATYNYPDDLKDSIEQVLNDVDRSLSPFNPGSIISAVNNNRAVRTDRHFQTVFNLAKQVSAQTDGAFDITVAPLVNAWGFGFKNRDNVSDSLITSLLAHVGFEKVSLDGDIVQKQDPDIMLDCSAIAKGYGVDAVGEILESKGIRNYMVEIGGEVRVRGVNPSHSTWRIGIIKPELDSLCRQQDIQKVLELSDISMATSGNYRNYYEQDGKRYAHTIDPRTGYPVQHNILSSTVLAPDCATADAFATAFMVLGLDDARRILAKRPDLKAFFVYSDSTGNNATWHTDNLQLEE